MALVKVQQHAPSTDQGELDPHLRVGKLERRLQRERSARMEAEAIAERGLRELYENQQKLMLLGAIATKANKGATVDDTLRFAVIEICKHTNWPIGIVYRPSIEGPQRLVSWSIWHATDTVPLRNFIEVSLAREFSPGVGLPGRVLESGLATWIPDVTIDANFPRRAEAKACGLRAAFAFPVLIGDEVAAVIEFYSFEARDPDPSRLAFMLQIGTQLGRVMERKRADDRLRYDASHDPLTGLPNRQLLLDRLDRAVADHKGARYNYSILFVDLDRFKLVNDSLGHAAGDSFLKEIGARLTATLTQAGASGLGVLTLARLGGDEFAVLIERIPRPQAAFDLAEQLHESLRHPLLLEGQEVCATASIGIASGEAGYATAADVMRDADLAMYRAKSQGRARTEVYDSSMHRLAANQLKLESDLRRAWRDKEFILHYQPIVAIDGAEIVGFEALLRWRRSPTELVPPSQFIENIEETGLIVFVGAWVLQEACAAMARWHAEFPRPDPIAINVNVSPRQFQQPNFVDVVRHSVTQSGIDPRAVRLEVTERLVIQDPKRTFLILEELQALGVRVAIDDFGTGYSSLSYLHRLPFDVLKIDRSFVSDLHTKVEVRKVVQTILDLARNLNKDVVVEGTESADDVDLLHAMGCRFAQGFYFSRPLDHQAASQLLARSAVRPTTRSDATVDSDEA
jgi:diguanylate cyclase (GGDEF)-like protein